MKRVTEPELMSEPSQVKAYAEADFSYTEQQIITKLETFLNQSTKSLDQNTVIIDLGCGPGNVTERIAMSWPTAKIFGIDGSKEMIKVAQRRACFLKEKFRIKNLEYLELNISNLSKEFLKIADCADVVVSNSLLHHIHNPEVFWNAVKNISSSGTVQYHRDLRRPLSYAQLLNIQKKYLPDAPSVLKNDYICSLQAAFSVNEIKEQLVISGLDQLNVFEVEERYLEVVGIL